MNLAVTQFGQLLQGTAATLVHKYDNGDNSGGVREGFYRFDLSPIDDEAFYGNDYHPNVYEDEKMAAELTAYLRKLMGWF